MRSAPAPVSARTCWAASTCPNTNRWRVRQTVETLKGIRADKVFLGSDGITLSNGVTTSDILEADVDRYIVQASRQVIVVADSSKIGVIGLVTLLQIEQVDTLVTDRDAAPEFVDLVESLGVQVILA